MIYTATSKVTAQMTVCGVSATDIALYQQMTVTRISKDYIVWWLDIQKQRFV